MSVPFRPEPARPGRSRPAPAAVVVGVSGGVDSAVALALLAREGGAIQAVFMKNWDEDDGTGECTALQDLADARAVCRALDVPLRAVNFAYEYWEHVFEHFLAECRRGRTPNPDIRCNQELKFRAFLDYARDLGAARLATGHYARVAWREDAHVLLKGIDPDKDQSYFLHRLDQQQLAAARFPLGTLRKAEVRALAREAGLPVHDKKDSTGICFIGERRFAAFLGRFLQRAPGAIESVEGERVGEHCGLPFYTIGQRQGLGIGGRVDGSGEPWYVAGKDLERNVLQVAQGRRHPALYARALVTEPAHWVRGEPPALPMTASARIRHRQPDQPCRLEGRADGGLLVRFQAPQWAVTPGQSVAIYRHDECLGGAVIEAACAP